MAIILASFDSSTGAMAVTVDGNFVPNVNYICLSKSFDGEYSYGTIETMTEGADGIQLTQRLQFSKSSEQPEVYSDSVVGSQIKDYFNRK